MSDQMDKVRELLLDLGHEIVQEVQEEELFVIKDEDKGICNMIVDCESPMVEIEQLILEIEGSASNYKRLLQMNRDLIHGSFVLDEEGSKVLFRDTLELENLDANELEATINALSLALAEFGEELLSFAK
ncbi:MAG: molecular chaperone Tir [Planctomycetota bacterium]|jgi:hypothetical protein|nr:molecular chaperone Tir [Planctomycetota bacterium]MDP7134785.1 molecular chaperone Tir [Planctomycetota bacterium]MDP7253488.1 molecular chaperone Tir [Planctomycetota bacterium]